MKSRFIKSVLATAQAHDFKLPFTRQARRSAMRARIAKAKIA